MYLYDVYSKCIRSSKAHPISPIRLWHCHAWPLGKSLTLDTMIHGFYPEATKIIYRYMSLYRYMHLCACASTLHVYVWYRCAVGLLQTAEREPEPNQNGTLKSCCWVPVAGLTVVLSIGRGYQPNKHEDETAYCSSRQGLAIWLVILWE